MRLTLSQQAVKLRPGLHQLLQQRRRRQLGGTKPDVGSHRGELKTERVPGSQTKSQTGVLRFHREYLQ